MEPKPQFQAVKQNIGNYVNAKPIMNQKVVLVQPKPAQNILKANIFMQPNIKQIQPINKKVEEEEFEEEEEEEKIEEIKLNENNNLIKCFLNEHKDIDAVIYCQECKAYMCNKCEKTHSGFLKHHHFYSLNKNLEEIFTGICMVPNHCMKLEYFCQTHNQLCCAACIAKIKKRGNGRHKKCKVFFISKIKNKKKEKLEGNIKHLEDLSQKLESSIKDLKTIFDVINENKEKLKKEVQNIFTKIRTELNNREDKLLSDIDEKFNKLFFNEEFIKKSERLPNLVKISLENGKINEKDWEDETKLNKLVNECIKIENTIKNINITYDKIKEYNSNKNIEFEFTPKNEDLKEELDRIKNFGKINRIEENRDYFIEKPVRIGNKIIE